jgi:hypothetical protein
VELLTTRTNKVETLTSKAQLKQMITAKIRKKWMPAAALNSILAMYPNVNDKQLEAHQR